MSLQSPSCRDGFAYDPTTLRYYADSAADYQAARPEGVSAQLPGFLSRLAPGARILELGCGGGRDAEAMIKAGFDLDPTDGVAEMALGAEKRLGRKVRVMRFDELDAIDGYDAVWAKATLLHVPRTELPKILKLIDRALKPGGFHFASFKAGGVEGRDKLDRYYNYLSRDQAVDLYRGAANWEIVSVDEWIGPSGGGKQGQLGPWVAITVRKAG